MLRTLISEFLKLASKIDAATLSQLRTEYKELLASERYSDPKRLNKFGYSLYSQTDEDGIIEEIFCRIGTTNRNFVEFGCGNGLENNSHALLLKGWTGLWIDGSEKLINEIRKKFRDCIETQYLQAVCAFINTDNINRLIGDHFEGEIDMLSIDLDGNDFYILNAITCISPRLIVVEYNARKGPSIDWVMNYNPSHVWDRKSDYFGASLKAFEYLLRRRGYSLVGCSTSGINAFFVERI